MKPAFQLSFEVDKGGQREHHNLTISEPKQTGEDWACEVEMTAFAKPKTIYGSSPEQALELAKEVAKAAYSGLTKLDSAGQAISWPD